MHLLQGAALNILVSMLALNFKKGFSVHNIQ